MSNNENMQDRKHAESHTIFHQIPKTNGEVLKIWDFMMPACHPRTGQLTGQYGRVRILAVFPKAPAPLENIKFSIAWCNPEDTKVFTKKRSNQILVGRYLKTFESMEASNHTGIVGKVENIKQFPVAALNALKMMPLWAAGLPTDWDYLQSKVNFQNHLRQKHDGVRSKMGDFQLRMSATLSATGTLTAELPGKTV